MTEEIEINISGLLKEMFDGTELLTIEQVRQLMQTHASMMAAGTGRKTSGRRAAKQIGVSGPYWRDALIGEQRPGAKILEGYHLEHVDMYRIVRDEE